LPACNRDSQQAMDALLAEDTAVQNDSSVTTWAQGYCERISCQGEHAPPPPRNVCVVVYLAYHISTADHVSTLTKRQH
jgi:hypothetical protein